MKVHTVCWLVFLAIAKIGFSNNPNSFTLEETQLTAAEGSCVEIKCKVMTVVAVNKAYWFWMKDPVYDEKKKDFAATIIYSTDLSVRPVSTGFANRTTYIGASPQSLEYSLRAGESCSVLICNLNKSDSGNYSFRFVNDGSKYKWVTKPEANLTVMDNPCLITFEKPPVVVENQTITLKCSTLSSCPSSLQIQTLTPQPLETLAMNPESKVTTHTFEATWKHDGSVFSCQTQDNTDKYLIQNISVTVEYPPKDTLAEISSTNIKEGESVTLTCSAKGKPEANFIWFKDGDKEMFSGAKWTRKSVKDSQNGLYHCEATNKHGRQKSNDVSIDVQYSPSVEIQISLETQILLQKSCDVSEGQAVTLTCNVTRANPKDVTFEWQKDSTIVNRNKIYRIESIKPEDSGAYRCVAQNAVGRGTSKERQLKVQYKPRLTNISLQGADNGRVKADSRLTFTCETRAYPEDTWISWYSYKKTEPSKRTELTSRDALHYVLTSVQRADEACYTCNTSNIIGKGDTSEPACIEVLFPPTNVSLSMDSMVTEGQHMTISCTAESNPPSSFTLIMPSKQKVLQPVSGKLNTYQHTFTVTSNDTGVYTCEASNSEGTNKSTHRKLVVKYAPKNVKVEAKPDLVVNETQTLTLNCRADSYPNLTSVTWMKTTNGKTEPIQGARETFSVKSAGPSDSGLYSCTATNEVGSSDSQQVDIKVQYAPKHIKITQGPVQQGEGTRFVKLSCNSHSYPPAKYSWYMKKEKKDMHVFDSQTITVYSQSPGEYYCVAKNKISQKRSEPVSLFDDSTMKAVKLFFLSCFILLLLLFIVFACRRRRNKSIRQRTARTRPFFGFLVWWNEARRINQMDETGLAEPSRSRDDLLSDQPFRTKGQQRQPRPDRTPAADINTVYSTVNLPEGQQAPSAQKPTRTNGGHVENDSLNYAFLHFGNKQKTPEEDVYSKVSKPMSSEEIKQEKLEDYENISAAWAAVPPNPYDYDDSDTSDEEVEVNYTQVTFKPNAGHQRADRHSSSSIEEVQYTEVKI